MTAGSLRKLHPATLSYHLLAANPDWAFLVLSVTAASSSDFPALRDMQLKQWTAMEGSKQSHGWLINDLCPLMLHPVVPQHQLFLLFAEGPIEDLVLQHFPRSFNSFCSQPLSGSLLCFVYLNTFFDTFLILLFAETPAEALVINVKVSKQRCPSWQTICVAIFQEK